MWRPHFPICGDPISPTCPKSNSSFSQLLSRGWHPEHTPFPHMWRPHFSHMSEIEFSFSQLLSRGWHPEHWKRPSAAALVGQLQDLKGLYEKHGGMTSAFRRRGEKTRGRRR